MKELNKITINFGDIISELESKQFKLCFIKDRGLFIEDRNNIYQMETYRTGSYLDRLIKDRIVVEFNKLDISISQNINDWEKEIWDVTEIKSFIKRQRIYKEGEQE